MKYVQLKAVLKTLSIVSLLGSIFVASVAFAGGGGQTVTLQTISKNVQDTVTYVTQIMSSVALVAGIGFVLASFFKFHQHKLNPTQVPLSQGLFLLVIGVALTVLPTIVLTGKQAVFGNDAEVSTVSGGQIKGLIGGTSGG